MALFTTLASSTTENGNAIATTTSATSPPTAIQLYTTKSFNFLLNSISNHDQLSSDEHGANDGSADDAVATTPGSPIPHHRTSGGGGVKRGSEEHKHPFAVLSYQAVQVFDVTNSTSKREEEAVALPLGLRKTSIKQHLKPNLGIWDCRVVVDESSSSSVLVNNLLSSVVGVKNNVETFVLAVDLSNPRAVKGAMSTMVDAIIQHLESKTKTSEEEESEEKGTTSLGALRSCAFGSATSSSSPQNEEEKAVNLLVCALVPPTSTKTTTYKEKQSQNLILYHLHKFALEVNCTLCFVRPYDEEFEENKEESNDKTPVKKGKEDGNAGVSSFGGGMVGTVSVNELAVLVRKLAASGVASLLETSSDDEGEEEEEEKKDAKEGEDEEEEDKKEEEKETTPPSADDVKPQAIYTPKSHDPDILKGVYLRNASCEGEWDAASDDLGKALPPPEKSSSNNTLANSANKAGDHEWLSRLYQSVGVVTPDAGGDDGASTVAGDKSFASPPGKGKKKAVGSTKKGGKGDANSGKKDDGDGDTQAFFQNLLGK